MTTVREFDEAQKAQPAAEEQRPLVEFPTSREDLKDFHTSAQKGAASAEKSSDQLKDCMLGLYLKPGTTVDVDKDCNFKVRPMTEAEREADRKQREYRGSPEFQKKMEETLRQFQ